MAEINRIHMSDYVTKIQFEGAIKTLNVRLGGMESALRQDIRDVISYVKEENALRDEIYSRRFDEIDSKLVAIMEMSAS